MLCGILASPLFRSPKHTWVLAVTGLAFERSRSEEVVSVDSTALHVLEAQRDGRSAACRMRNVSVV